VASLSHQHKKLVKSNASCLAGESVKSQYRSASGSFSVIIWPAVRITQCGYACVIIAYIILVDTATEFFIRVN